jgi:hypothetical protein
VSQLTRSIAGLALAMAMGLTVLSTLAGAVPLRYAGLAAWLAGLLLWRSAPRRTRIQSAVLIGIGLAGLLVPAAQGMNVDWGHAISGNAALIAMLAAVSFLRLITAPAGDAEAMPRGGHSLWRTLLGVHLFGAVVNLSTVFIMARRMARDERLSRRQYEVLVKGFSAAAFWSPFFAAMAAALTYAPGARLSVLVGYGGVLATLALTLALLQARRGGAADFVGYPMNPAALWLPAVLAVMILAAHAVWPAVSILGLIALLAPSVTAMTLVVRRHSAAPALARHVRQGLPAMHAELVLFLSAGVTAAGLASLVNAYELALPFAGFGAPQAALLLAVLVAAAVVGIHPVIGVAAAAAVVEPLAPDPDLLASVFLAAWGIGVAASPLSGLNLAMQGSYGIRASDILRWNGPFALAMLALASALLWWHPAG